MFKLTRYFKKYSWQMTIGPFFKFLEAATDIISPWLVSLIIDVGVINNDKPYIWKMALLVIALNVIGIVCAIICQKMSALSSEGVGKDIRSSMYKKITTYSNAEYDKFSTMSLTNRCVHDVDQVQTAIAMTLRQMTRAPFLLVGSTIMAMLIDVRLSIIFWVLMPILAFSTYYIMKKTSPIYIEAKVNLDNVSNVTRENLSGIRVVRAFNKQNVEKERFNAVNKELTKSVLKVGTISAVLQPVLMMVVNFATLAIVYYGGVRVNVGGLSQGNILAFINYFAQIAVSLVTIARLLLVFTKTGASLKRIGEVFEVENSVKNQDNPIAVPDTIKGDIEFKNVSFAYENSAEVVKDLSIKIKAGQTIGIIGGTGSGKSSVANLIPRLYDATSGEVLIDGINVKNYEIKQLRGIIGYVSQNPTLFKGTLAENMRWRKEFATNDEIIKALKIAQAFDFVRENPDFLNQKIERGGVNYSGGQKQRLTIARALVGNPKILILDDSSSALDFATDAKLRDAIQRNLKDITTIVVSQRTNSIKYADNIIVMDNGNIAGIGKHDYLLKNCSVYKEIYSSQNKEEVSNA